MKLVRLKQMREERKINQTDLAEVLRIKQQQYSEYEIGKRQIPVTYLSKLADYYDVSIDYLLERTDEKKPYPKSIMVSNNTED